MVTCPKGHPIHEWANGICQLCTAKSPKANMMRFININPPENIQPSKFFDEQPKKREPLFWRKSIEVQLRDILTFWYAGDEYEMAFVLGGTEAIEDISFECTISEEIDWFLAGLEHQVPGYHVVEEKTNLNGLRNFCRVDHLSGWEVEISEWLHQELSHRGWEYTQVSLETDIFFFHKARMG